MHLYCCIIHIADFERMQSTKNIILLVVWMTMNDDENIYGSDCMIADHADHDDHDDENIKTATIA